MEMLTEIDGKKWTRKLMLMTDSICLCNNVCVCVCWLARAMGSDSSCATAVQNPKHAHHLLI